MKKIKYLIVLAMMATGLSLSSCIVRAHAGGRDHGHYENDDHGNHVWVNDRHN